MSLYAGIDLHASNSYLAVIDETDELVLAKRLPNDIESVRGALEPYRQELVSIAVESTFNWYWLVDGLEESGFTVHLVNTLAAKQYQGLKYTDDKTDARWLAHMLRLGILPTGWISTSKVLALNHTWVSGAASSPSLCLPVALVAASPKRPGPGHGPRAKRLNPFPWTRHRYQRVSGASTRLGANSHHPARPSGS